MRPDRLSPELGLPHPGASTRPWPRRITCKRFSVAARQIPGMDFLAWHQHRWILGEPACWARSSGVGQYAGCAQPESKGRRHRETGAIMIRSSWRARPASWPGYGRVWHRQGRAGQRWHDHLAQPGDKPDGTGGVIYAVQDGVQVEDIPTGWQGRVSWHRVASHIPKEHW